MRRNWTRAARVGAIVAVLTGALVAVGGSTPAAAAPDSFVGLVPARLLETRGGLPTVDGSFQGIGAVGPGSTTDLVVVGRGSVPPSNVGAVALNVTVTGPTAASFVTVFPTGEPQPTASNLNMVPGQTVSNMVIVPVGAGGQISLFNLSGQTELVVDVLGWFPTGASFGGLTPARLLETRAGDGLVTTDGQQQGIGPLGAGQTLALPVAGRGLVPATGVGAVALNVTVTRPTASSFVTVFPLVRPTASNLNMEPGQTVSNMVIVPVNFEGLVNLFNLSGQTDLVVDVLGWFPTGASFGGLDPARLLDTRTGAGLVTIDGEQQGIGPLGANREIELPVLGRGLVPATGVGAVALNVTVTEPTGSSFLTVYPTGQLRPTASNLNTSPGQTVSNMVIVPVGLNGRISLYNLNGTAQVVVDVLGWFPAEAGSSNPTTTTTPPPPVTFTRLVNAGTNGAATGGATGVSISADARYVAFASPANNIVLNDTNPFTDVFVRDLVSNSVVRVSIAAGGGNDDGNSVEPSISANGSRIAFHTDAALVPSDTNGVMDVYVRDLAAQTTTRVSSPLVAGTAGDSTWPAISGNGRYVAFNSVSDNLVNGDTNGHIDVFVRDLNTGITERASVGTGGTQASGGFGSFDPDVSDDGNLVVFSSNETSLGGPDANVRHIYVRNRSLNTTTLLTRTQSNVPSSAGVAQDPSISSDGAWVMFHSTMSDLVGGDFNGVEDVFRVASASGPVTRVGLSTDEGQGEGANTMINANGRYITFSSDFDVNAGLNGQREVYRYDVDLGATVRFSVDTNGVTANGPSRDSAISGDGRTIAFLSTATNLGGTASGGSNVYVRFVP